MMENYFSALYQSLQSAPSAEHHLYDQRACPVNSTTVNRQPETVFPLPLSWRGAAPTPTEPHAPCPPWNSRCLKKKNYNFIF